MSGEDYRPREHDHLVEPVFGGLGVEPRPERRGDGHEPEGVVRALWRRFVRVLAALVRRAGRGG